MARTDREWTETGLAAARLAARPRAAPDFTINIRSASGARVQITVTRWGSKLITGEGVKSARAISRGIEMLLRFCVP